MNLLPTLGLVALLAAMVGCESDLPPERSEVANTFQRGVRGQGTLYQPDRSNDPLIREQSRVGY